MYLYWIYCVLVKLFLRPEELSKLRSLLANSPFYTEHMYSNILDYCLDKLFRRRASILEELSARPTTTMSFKKTPLKILIGIFRIYI